MQDPIDPSEQLAEALRGLELPPPGMSASQLLYRAGYEAGRRNAITWKAVAASLALVGAVAVAWTQVELRRPSVPPVLVHSGSIEPAHPEAAMERPPIALFTSSQFALRDALLQHGLDALPAPDFQEGSQHSLRAGSSPDGVPPVDNFIRTSNRGSQ